MISTWSYRVLRYDDGSLGLHEVYYDVAGRAVTCTEDTVDVVGDDLVELRAELEMMLRALDEPIMEYFGA